MKVYFYSIALFVLLATNTHSSAHDNSYILEQVKLTPIRNSLTGAQYELYIKLPNTYSTTPLKHYPVIYLTDAKWQLPVFSALSEWLLSEVILVGISWQTDNNSEFRKQRGEMVSRYRDYTFKTSTDLDKQKKYQYGGANNHLAFIRNDVINHIEKNYRTDPKNRAYFGYSLGGLFGAYVLTVQPNTFKHYMLGSPSIWQNTPTLKQLTDKNQNSHINLFVSYGKQEEKLGKSIESFITLLSKHNNKPVSISKTKVEGEHSINFPLTAHQSITWLAKQL